MDNFGVVPFSTNISCIYAETIFSCMTIKSSEKFGRQYKYLDPL